MQPLSGNQHPDLVAALMSMSLARHLPREMHLARSSAYAPCLLQNPHILLIFWQGAQSLAPAMRNDIWTSKSAPYPSVFCTFYFEMCFAPQGCALFWHHNFEKCSEAAVLCAFSLGNVLRATTACTFSTSQRPKMLWTRQFWTLLTWKCASRHTGVQFFISHLASWLRTRRFSEPTFRPSRATNQWKNTVFRDFLLPFRAPETSFFSLFLFLIFFLLLFSSLTLPISAFHLSKLLEVDFQTSFDNESL